MLPPKGGFASGGGPGGERGGESRRESQREDGESENCRKFGEKEHFVVDRGGIRILQLVLVVLRT